MGRTCAAESIGVRIGLLLLMLRVAAAAAGISRQQVAVAAAEGSSKSVPDDDHSGAAAARLQDDPQQHRRVQMMVAADHAHQYVHHHRLQELAQQQQQSIQRDQRWYNDNSSSTSPTTDTPTTGTSNPCIFPGSSSGTTFTYLHIAYVFFFNISTSTLFFPAALHDCLDTCILDCACSAVVYNTDIDGCYQFHGYIPIQTLPFNPVRKGESLSAYVKVQAGNPSNALTLLPPLLFLLPIVSAAAALLIP